MDKCSQLILARKFCYENSGKSRGGEDCLIEELMEKRCLAANLCPSEAASYYGDSDASSGSKGLCALWGEAFAFTRDDAKVLEASKSAHRRGQEIVQADKRKAAACRERVHALSKCLAEYSPF